MVRSRHHNWEGEAPRRAARTNRARREPRPTQSAPLLRGFFARRAVDRDRDHRRPRRPVDPRGAGQPRLGGSKYLCEQSPSNWPGGAQPSVRTRIFSNGLGGQRVSGGTLDGLDVLSLVGTGLAYAVPRKHGGLQRARSVRAAVWRRDFRRAARERRRGQDHGARVPLPQRPGSAGVGSFRPH